MPNQEQLDRIEQKLDLLLQVVTQHRPVQNPPYRSHEHRSQEVKSPQSKES